MIRYSLIFAVAASVAACTTAPIDLVPESERAYAKSQARTGNTGGAVTVDNMLDDVRHRGSGVFDLSFRPGVQALDRASATRLRDQVDGRGVARIAVGGSRGAEGYEAAALALRRGRDLARLAGTPEDSVEILFQPSLPPDTARVFIGAV